METVRSADGEDDAGATVRRVREKLAWMQGIVQEGLARTEPGCGGNSEDATDVVGVDGPLAWVED
jgi:hypothetical protein